MNATDNAPASCKVLLANVIAEGLLTEVQHGLQKLRSPAHLLGVLANVDPAAKLYANWTAKTCKE